MTADALNGLTDRILGAAFKVHTELCPGLLESTYQVCLVYELVKAGLQVEAQVPLPVVYDGQKLLDILVENEVVIELKSIEAIAPVHRAQLLSYLKHSGRRVGLLINFKC